jgi:lactoylglutathione lyase
MQLAKPQIDVGLYTNNAEAMLDFWQRVVGLPFDHMLPLGQGVRQQRHEMNGSVFKLNTARDPLPDADPSGYRELLIARQGVSEPQQLRDPDDNVVTLVAPGHLGITGIALRLAVRSVQASTEFYSRAMGLDVVSPGVLRCGESLLLLIEDPNIAAPSPMRARGYRYFTVQVADVDHEHAVMVAAGAQQELPPITLGTTARISLLRDPDGNWIELSQRDLATR